MKLSEISLPNENAQHCSESLSGFPSFNYGLEDDTRSSQIDVSDHVAILASDCASANCSKQWNNEPMPLFRRCCLIASCALCVLSIYAFLWLIPCRDSSQCPAVLDRIRTHNWINNYTKIEPLGGLQIGPGLRNWERNVIMLYRGDLFYAENSLSGNNKRNGIMSIIGSSGAIAWFNEMQAQPLALDCSMLDIDRNLISDCLLIDELGVLYALNAQTGHRIWRYQAHFLPHQRNIPYALDLPLVLPDLDGDAVSELLLVSSAEPNRVQRNYLRILSGRQGRPLGEEMRLHDCDALRQVQIENAQFLKYICLRNRSEILFTKSLPELYALVTNKSAVGMKQLSKDMKRKIMKQQRHYAVDNETHLNNNNNHNNNNRHTYKDENLQRKIYMLSGRELMVQNVGHCPENCSVTLMLSERSAGGKDIPKVLRNFTQSSMHGMVPVEWHFKDKRTSKIKMSGFVMKFWKWNNITNNLQNGTYYAVNLTKPINDKYIIANKVDSNHRSNRVLFARQQRHQPEIMLNGKTAAEVMLNDSLRSNASSFQSNPNISKAGRMFYSPNQSNLSNNKFMYVDNYKKQMITESVILVLFIGNETRIENTSQSSIVQFCRNEHTNNNVFTINRRRRRFESVCQPELSNQENSMIIADLDQDGSQELVTYTSTFVQPTADNPRDWRLVTYVRLLRLQSELPTFYKQNTHY